MCWRSLSNAALLRADHVLALVPEARKAKAVHAALTGPVSPHCPASIRFPLLHLVRDFIFTYNGCSVRCHVLHKVDETGSVNRCPKSFGNKRNRIADAHRTWIVAGIEAQIATLTAYRKSLIHECVSGQRRTTAAGVAQVNR